MELSKKHALKKIGFEAEDLTVAEYNSLQASNITLLPVSMKKIRIVKNEYESEHIEKACKIGDKAFSYILEKIKPGKTENEIAFLLETFIREQNAKLSFDAIIAFGPNSAIPHHIS